MRTILLFILLLASPVAVNAQYAVSDYGDIGDSVDDGIYFPKTLRSAIQNANRGGVPATIKIQEDKQTITVGTRLPDIFVPVHLEGDGLIIEPATPGGVSQGLTFSGNGSKLEKTHVRNFAINGISWRCSDGIIANVQSHNNGSANLQLIEAHRNVIGTDFVSGYASDFYYGGDYGITLYLSDDNIIQFSAVGIDPLMLDGNTEYYGIFVDKCHRTLIRKNTISGNGEHGIWVDGFSEDDVTKFHSSHNVIEDNNIGTNTDVAELSAIPNGGAGVMISNSTDDIVRNNIVSGNLGAGIHVQSARAGSSSPIDGRFLIENNKVGVGSSTKLAIPNGRGISVGSKNCIIRNNIASGNTGQGIDIGASNNILQSNIVGLDSAQTVAVPNGEGIRISNRFEEGHAVIGDTLKHAGNIVAGNTGVGIYVFVASTKRVVIARNKIGVNKEGVAFPNGGDGIFMKYSVRDILVKENQIGANGGHGINIERNVVYYLDTTKPPFFQRPSNITIRDNCIGCVRQGDTTGKHGGSGIYVFNADTITISDNTISGTAGDGITITNDSTRAITIRGNAIGADLPAYKQIGGDGIRVSGAEEVLIGGTNFNFGTYNTITGCRGYGVSVQDSAQEVTITCNEFKNNVKGGIALDDLKDYFDERKFNDRMDADTGSNQLQNTIDQTEGWIKDKTIGVAGTFHGKPNESYRVDVYLAQLPTGDKRTNQGTLFMDWFAIRTNELGVFELDTAWAPGLLQLDLVDDYPLVTMTVTGVQGTSSFSHVSPREGVDVVVRIDTARSKMEADGKVTIYAVITNRGSDPPTTVSLRDTVSNFDLESVTISKGVAFIVDSTFVATIPALANGEVIEYAAVGRVRTPGMHKRRLVAMTSEVDENPTNNADSIQLLIQGLNDVSGISPQGIEIRALTANFAEIHGLTAGSYRLRSHDLLGRTIMDENVKVQTGQPVEIWLDPGVNLIEIIRDGTTVHLLKILRSH